MLALTPTAIAAVHALLGQPDLPAGSALRLQAQTDAEGRPGIGIEVAGVAFAGDEHVAVGGGHDVLVAEEIATMLADQLLDADLDDQRVAFSLGPQLLGTAAPAAGS